MLSQDLPKGYPKIPVHLGAMEIGMLIELTASTRSELLADPLHRSEIGWSRKLAMVEMILKACQDALHTVCEPQESPVD